MRPRRPEFQPVIQGAVAHCPLLSGCASPRKHKTLLSDQSAIVDRSMVTETRWRQVICSKITGCALSDSLKILAAGGWVAQRRAEPGQGLQLRLGSKLFTKGDDLFQHFSMVRCQPGNAHTHLPHGNCCTCAATPVLLED